MPRNVSIERERKEEEKKEEGKGRKGKERKGRERKGKERKAKEGMALLYKCTEYVRSFLFPTPLPLVVSGVPGKVERERARASEKKRGGPAPLLLYSIERVQYRCLYHVAAGWFVADHIRYETLTK